MKQKYPLLIALALIAIVGGLLVSTKNKTHLTPSLTTSEAGFNDIVIKARGTNGQEKIALYINNTPVQFWNLTTNFQNYIYTPNGEITVGELSIHFLNDKWEPENNINYDVQIPFITVNGTTYNSEHQSTISTGSWDQDNWCAPGNKQTQWLHCNGSFTYNIPVGTVVGLPNNSDEPSEPDESTEPNTSGECVAAGSTLQQAKEAFQSVCSGTTRQDCDEYSGGWICSSEDITAASIALLSGEGDPIDLEDPDEEDPSSEDPVVRGDANVVKLPVKMENLYKYNVNSVSDLVTYKQGSQWKQVLTFYGADRRLKITRRDFPDGSQWETPVDVHNAIGNDPLEYDSHNSTAFGIAPDGTMFVTANHHVDPLRMARSTRPYDITSFVNVPRSELNTADTDRVTYPSFFYLNDQLFFSYREQEVGGGNPRFRWLIKRYDAQAKKWHSSVTLNTGISLRLYVSNVAWSSDGKVAHLSAIWRDESNGAGGTELQHDLFHLYSNDGSTWKQLGGSTVNLPLSWQNGNSTVAQNIWDTPPSPIPSNAGSIAIDSQGNPHILMDERGGDAWHHEYTGSEWDSKKIGFTSTTDDLFRVGNKMGAVVHRGEEIRFHMLDSSHPSYNNGILLADGYVNSVYTVSVDKTAADLGYLSIMMTTNKHASPNQATGTYPTDAYVMTIPIDDLATFTSPFRR